MVVTPTSDVSAAYDATAQGYEQRLLRDRWVRRALWRHFARALAPGARVLDVGCGTGIDTMHLASAGMKVTAIDVSVGMLEQLRKKVAESSLGVNVDIHLGDASEVMSGLHGPFDAIVSSFAAMNTMDLDALARQAARILRPGGRVVAQMLSPLYGTYGLKAMVGQALRPNARRVRAEIGLVDVQLEVMPAADLYRRYFARSFIERKCYALGRVLGMPVEKWLSPNALDAVARLEARCFTAPPFVAASEFYVIDLERRGA